MSKRATGWIVIPKPVDVRFELSIPGEAPKYGLRDLYHNALQFMSRDAESLDRQLRIEGALQEEPGTAVELSEPDRAALESGIRAFMDKISKGNPPLYFKVAPLAQAVQRPLANQPEEKPAQPESVEPAEPKAAE